MSETVYSEFICSICFCIFTHTVVAKECFHRFCKECITNALRRGNKECPTYRENLILHRSLRDIVAFDSFIAKIYGDRDLYETRRQNAVVQHNQFRETRMLFSYIILVSSNEQNMCKYFYRKQMC